jgi:hypothetical protein
MSFVSAVLFSVRIVNALVTRYLSEGAFVSGASELFYEWLMPIFQVIALIGLLWPLTAGSSNDAPRAARA